MSNINLINPETSVVKYKSLTFPDGQPHIKLDLESMSGIDKMHSFKIYTRVNTPADLMLLLFLKNTLDYLGFEKVDLYISYLLAARMDRVMLDGEPFSLKVVAAVLNQATFHRIYIFDPHSEVTTALINRSYNITNHQFVKDAIVNYYDDVVPEDYILVSPDAGALKKIHKLAQFLQTNQVVECMKERDVKTGALTNFKTLADDLKGQTCFIVDDICDGGGTFAGTAKMLKEKNAGKVNLIVSHGIFNKGTALPFIDAIYTTNSFRQVENINCFDVNKYLKY